MTGCTKYVISVFLFLILSISVLFTACNKYDTDYERNNPNDPLVPNITILSPENETVSYHKDSVLVKVQVSDENTPLTDLKIKLYSNIDGLISSIQANSDGIGSIMVGGLSINPQYLKAEVTNNLGHRYSDKVLLYNDAPPVANVKNVKLVDAYYNEIEWTQSTDSYFESYKVYRISSLGDTLLVATLNDIGNTVFRDAAPLDTLTQYYLETTSTFSETTNTGEPGFVSREIFSKPQRISKYPGEPILLLHYQFHLIAYNYEQNEVIGSISEGAVTTSAVGNNGFGPEIYVVFHSNNRILHIYDGITLELKVVINANYNIRDINTDNRGNIISRDGAQFRVSSRTDFPYFDSGVFVQNCIHCSHGVFKTVKTSNDIYFIASGVWHIKYNNNNSILEATRWPYSNNGPIIDRFNFEIHPHGEYLITAAPGNLIDKAPSLQYIATLRLGAQYDSFVFNDSGETIYAADDRGWVDIFENFNYIERIWLELKPISIFYKNNNLIMFGRSTVLEDYFGVMVLPESVLDI